MTQDSQQKTERRLLNPCPSCGKEFGTMGCATGVLDLTFAKTDTCPRCGTQVVIVVPVPDPWDGAQSDEEIRCLPLENFEFSVGTTRILEEFQLRTIGELLDLAEQDFLELPKRGPRTLVEVKDLLNEKGLSLKQELEGTGTVPE